MNSLKTNLIYILIIALLLMILYETCKHKGGVTKISSSDTTTQINYVYYRDTSRTKPVFLRGSRDTVFENTIEFRPSEDYKTLVSQFDELKQILLSRNIYLDSIHLDSLGWVKITDTVQKNALLGRNIVKDIKIPGKETTIIKTIEAPKRRQMYVGGGVFFNPKVNGPSIFGNNVYSGMTSVGGRLLYKSKTDQIIGAGLQWDGKQTNYELSGYLKLSFKKKD